MPEPTIETLLGWLNSSQVVDINRALDSITFEPTGDPRIIAALQSESLTQDTRLCIAFVPIHYCEIRWLAGNALAHERAFVGNNTYVIVTNTFYPMSATKLSSFAKRKTGIIPLQEVVEDKDFPRTDWRFIPEIIRHRMERNRRIAVNRDSI